MAKEHQRDHGRSQENVPPRDAQKGGQGAVSKKHPERQLDQDNKSGGANPSKDKETKRH